MRSSDSSQKAVEVVQLTVKDDRVVCEILIADKEYRNTSSDVISHIVQDFPEIAQHTCKNSTGLTFASVMEDTPIPHLLEHLTLELQAKYEDRPYQLFVGTSEWTDEKLGHALIEVSFTDDLNALRAFQNAISIVNKAML